MPLHPRCQQTAPSAARSRAVPMQTEARSPFPFPNPSIAFAERRTIAAVEDLEGFVLARSLAVTGRQT